jgi:hypothetical protein
MLVPGPGRAEQHEAWIRVRSPNFAVTSNAAEKPARAVAKQLEEIRAVFHGAFPGLRVDFPVPLTVIAVKDEASAKKLLPDYWTREGGVRPAGIYVSSFDENFVILRLEAGATAESSYRALYHEYAHGILRLNYRELPAWLSEGLAEFFGNTAFAGNDAELGHINAPGLGLLQRAEFLPLEELLRVDRESALYNERDHASIFYAEAWALVHYLMLDPEGSKNEPLIRYVKAYAQSEDAVAAARATFGDLGELDKKLRGYIAQKSFQSGRIKRLETISESDFSVKEISEAEALATEADFLQHTRHEKEADVLLSEALALEPKTGSAHAARGYAAYLHFYDEASQKEFREAVALNAKDFRSNFYLAELAYREKGFTPESTAQIVGYLERTVELNENFAPAYAFLSTAYLQQPETRDKALDAARSASRLEPTSMAYGVNVGNALLALHRDAEAGEISETLSKSARTPLEKSVAREFAKRLAQHEELLAKKRGSEADVAALGVVEVPPDTPLLQPTDGVESDVDWRRVASEWTETVEGEIRDADATEAPRVKLKFATAGEILHLSVADATAIAYRVRGVEAAVDAIPCSQWKGRKAKIVYRAASVEGMAPEILSIDFK